MLGYDLGFGVLGAYSKSIDDIEIAGYNFNYNLENYVLKLGADYRKKVNLTFYNLPSALRLYLYETIFLGDDLYLEHYIETGVELLSKQLNYSKETYHMVTLGVEFVTGLDNDYDAVNLKISYRY